MSEENEENSVRCLICGEFLSFSQGRTDSLLFHLREKHPFVHVVKSLQQQSPLPLGAKGAGDNPKFPESANGELAGELDNEYGHPVKSKLGKKSGFGPGKVFCPACRKFSSPTMKRQKNNCAGGKPKGACLMLGCWPLCYIPFFVLDNRVINVYCSNCSYFIGSYDTKLNILMTRPHSKMIEHLQK